MIPAWARLLSLARPPMRTLGGVTALMLVGVALDVLKPWPMKLLVDHVLTAHTPPPAWLRGLAASPASLAVWLAISTVALFVLAQLARMMQNYLQAYLGSRMVYRLGAELFERLQGLSLIFHNNQRKGDMVRRVVTDSACVRDLLLGVVIPTVTAIAVLVAMFLVMWRMSPVLALVALGVAGPLGLIIRYFVRPMADRSYTQQQLEGELISHAERALSAMPVVQAYVREDMEDRRFKELSDQTLASSLRTLWLQHQFRITTGATTALGTAAVMLIAGRQVLAGELSIGQMLVFLSYLVSLYSPMETLAYVSMSLASSSAGARRVLDVLESQQAIRESPHAKPPFLPEPQQGAQIEFENVSFGYDGANPVLHDINLAIRRGEMVALVGPTGAGKSTLVSLIPRLFDPISGSVKLEGADLRDLSLKQLRELISIVPQDPLLLPMTVRENIAYGRPDATTREIAAAAEAANAASFIRQLPHGYQTVLGERNANLSGGQRQRLAIARALLRNTPILILDEPSSALDANAERHLVDALQQVRKGRTCIVIAHRFSTIEAADRVAVLQAGRVVEQGTHAELLAADGMFRQLHAIQSSQPLAAR